MNKRLDCKNFIAGFLLATGFTCAPLAQASLTASADGTLIYDSDLNITWLADANYAHSGPYGHTTGLMSWNEANNSWASNLTFHGNTDWRLPTIDEMKHLRNDELGGSNYNLFASHNPNFNLFSNLNNNWYWTSTENPNNSAEAPVFNLGNSAVDSSDPKSYGYYAMAVTPGNIAVVPEPETYALLLAGLGLVGFIARRRKQTSV